MALKKEFYHVVNKGKRVYLPSEFKKGEPVKITVERVVELEINEGSQ